MDKLEMMKVDALVELALATDEHSRNRALRNLELIVGGRTVDANEHKSVQEYVEEILTELGAPCNLLGYDYLLTATCMAVEDPSVRKMFTSRVYPNVGAEYGTTAARVERSIRTIIMSILNKGNATAIRNYFGSILSPYSNGITNSAFICRLAREVERKMQFAKKGVPNEVD